MTMTGERILFELRLHHRAEPGEAAPQIGHPGHDPHPRSGSQFDHRRSVSRIMRSDSALGSPSTVSSAWPGNSMWIAPLGCGLASAMDSATSAASLAIRTGNSLTPPLPRSPEDLTCRLCATQTPGSLSPRRRGPPAAPKLREQASPPRSAASAPPGNATGYRPCAYSLLPVPPLKDEADEPDKPDALTGRLRAS